MVRSVVDVPAGPASSGCLGEVGRLAVRAVAGGYVGDEFDVGRGAFGGGDGSDPFLRRAAVGAHGRIPSAALRVDEPEVAHDAVHVSAVFFVRRLTRRVALRRAGREALAVAPEDDVVSLLPGWAVEDMPVEAARFQDDVRRPVRDVEQPLIEGVQRQLAVVVVGVDEQAEAGVLFVLGADGPAALLANRPQRRHENAQQKRDDGDNHEKLDECESSFSVHCNHPAVRWKSS